MREMQSRCCTPEKKQEKDTDTHKKEGGQKRGVFEHKEELERETNRERVGEREKEREGDLGGMYL